LLQVRVCAYWPKWFLNGGAGDDFVIFLEENKDLPMGVKD